MFLAGTLIILWLPVATDLKFGKVIFQVIRNIFDITFFDDVIIIDKKKTNFTKSFPMENEVAKISLKHILTLSQRLDVWRVIARTTYISRTGRLEHLDRK